MAIDQGFPLEPGLPARHGALNTMLEAFGQSLASGNEQNGHSATPR